MRLGVHCSLKNGLSGALLEAKQKKGGRLGLACPATSNWTPFFDLLVSIDGFNSAVREEMQKGSKGGRVTIDFNRLYFIGGKEGDGKK